MIKLQDIACFLNTFRMIFFCVPVFLLLSCQVPPLPGESTESPEAEVGSSDPAETPRIGDSEKIPPFLGIAYEAIELNKISSNLPKKAIRIIKVLPDTVADEIGLKEMDLILKYDFHSFDNVPKDDIPKTFKSYITSKKWVGDPLRLEIFREETKISGQKNSTSIPSEGLRKEMISELINTQKPGEVLNFTIEKKAGIRKLTAKLGTRPNMRTTAPPKNSQLFPQYENYTSPSIEFSNKLIVSLNLETEYEDLMKRYQKDEWWDDGFRLKTFRYIHQDPLKLPKIANDLSADFERAIHAKSQNFPDLISRAAAVLDETIESGVNRIPPAPGSHNFEEHLTFIVETVVQARQLRDHALRRLSNDEIQFLYENLQGITDKFAEHYYLDNDTPPALFKKFQKVIKLSHKIDFPALLQAAQLLSYFADRDWLSSLKSALALRDWGTRPANNPLRTFGDIMTVLNTAAGPMVIGGEGPTRYEQDIAIIIDLGGDDLYINNAGAARSPEMPISVLIDLGGNDTYSATKSVAQGSGMLGNGILIDQAGDDTYTGVRLSQGTGLMGTGILIDFAGSDQYHGQEFNQGFGLWGSGMLVDLKGDDSYNSHLFAQGVGAPKGLGLLLDVQGSDRYYATGKYQSTYKVEGLFHGSSQGFGIGFRNLASGGVGILLDSQGKDSFRAGNFSQGGGYFYGLGILKNGNQESDLYIGSRYTQGFSAHSAAGILIEEGGDDHYIGKVGAIQAAAWDKGSAALIDYAGNDTYDTLGWGFAQGAAEHNGFSLFIDWEGVDVYRLQGRTKPKNEYDGGSSFSFFIDNGGENDQYSEGSGGNNQIKMEGEYGIFVDLDAEIEDELEDNTFEHLILPTKE
ncbi:MAG: hypothetical protein HQM13_11180 [SAR324 cluster bacterium]|nr:hypothetical protein [SAR324 cluster bacterium]